MYFILFFNQSYSTVRSSLAQNHFKDTAVVCGGIYSSTSDNEVLQAGQAGGKAVLEKGCCRFKNRRTRHCPSHLAVVPSTDFAFRFSSSLRFSLQQTCPSFLPRKRLCALRSSSEGEMTPFCFPFFKMKLKCIPEELSAAFSITLGSSRLRRGSPLHSSSAIIACHRPTDAPQPPPRALQGQVGCQGGTMLED